MKFQSNKLDSLGEVLGVGRKMPHQGIKLWIDSMFGNPDALDTMLEYNKQDVTLLIDVYNKLKAFDNRAPNAGLYTDEQVPVCRVCGSNHVEPTGNVVTTAVSKFIEVQCGSCGARSRTRQALNTSKERKLLLA
jgi:ribosomal protein S27E